MVATKAADDFNAIISAGRERRENEKLAKDIFGKHRRASAPAAGITKRKPIERSLASRIGAVKPAKPPPKNVHDEWTHDLYKDTARPARGQTTRAARLAGGLNGVASVPDLRAQVNIVKKTPPAPAAVAGLSIRGIAGNCAVTVQNLAPGTTAADIETALSPVGGTILSCQILSSFPSVSAELVFESRDGAVSVVETFNNRTADGRVIRLSIKPSTPSTARPQHNAPTGPRADSWRERSNVVDGSFGFDDAGDDSGRGAPPHRGARSAARGLYSDSLTRRPTERGRGNRRGAARASGAGR